MAPLISLLKHEQYTDAQGAFDMDVLRDSVPLPPVAAPARQTKRVEGTAQKVHSSWYRNAQINDELIDVLAPQFDTLAKLFDFATDRYADSPCFGSRHPIDGEDQYENKFSYETYSTVKQRRDRIGSGIRTLVGRDDNYVVALYSANRAEWAISMYATQAYGMTYTALYDTLGPRTSAYILNLTEAPVIILAKNRLHSVLSLKRNDLPNLKFIITMEPLNLAKDFGLIQLAESYGVKLLDFAQLEELGRWNPQSKIEASPETTFGISFTSGTTGNPKGVEITHRMLAAFVVFSLTSASSKTSTGEQTRALSFLPLAHIYEVTTLSMELVSGCSIAFPPDPSPLKLVENLCIVKPHVAMLVPRVYTKMEGSIKDKLESSAIGRQVLKSIEHKVTTAKDSEINRSFMLDALLKGARTKLGLENTICVFSGSAPISAETVRFLRVVLGTGFAQGYGLTESTSGVFLSNPYENDITCGAVAVTCEFRLRALPEIGYHTHDKHGVELNGPQGELLLRGPQIFPRYYKNPEATADSFDEQGWFKTGDVASMDSRGRILIVDRVKNFFKLAQGEYVTPERIENTYLSVCSFLNQMYAHGDSLRTYLVGVAGVDPVAFMGYLSRNKKLATLAHLPIDQALKKLNEEMPELKRLILKEMESHVKTEGLQGFEKLHNVKFMVEPLKIEDDTITPTMKIKRNIASRYFKDVFAELYNEGSMLNNNNNKL